MGNTEIIKLEEKEFKVFRRIPVPISREVQKLLIEMAENYQGDLNDFETGKVSPKDAKNINFNILYEIYDLLLTKCVITPKIENADIQNIDHDLQPYFQDLSDLLFEKWADSKSMVKKKLPNGHL